MTLVRPLVLSLSAIFCMFCSLRALAEVPKALFIVGCVYIDTPTDTYNWEGLEFNKDENIFTLEDVHFFESPMAGETQSEFMISTDHGSLKAVQATPFGYAAGNFSETESGDITTSLTIKSSSLVCKIDPGTYNITITYSTGIIGSGETAATMTFEKIKIPTGVESVAAATDCEIDYFTLDGQRVAAPISGIYICRQGAKVWKTFIRR